MKTLAEINGSAAAEVIPAADRLSESDIEALVKDVRHDATPHDRRDSRRVAGKLLSEWFGFGGLPAPAQTKKYRDAIRNLVAEKAWEGRDEYGKPLS